MLLLPWSSYFEVTFSSFFCTGSAVAGIGRFLGARLCSPEEVEESSAFELRDDGNKRDLHS